MFRKNTFKFSIFFSIKLIIITVILKALVKVSTSLETTGISVDTDTNRDNVEGEDYEERVMSTQYCGYLWFNTAPGSTRVNITENTPIPSQLFQAVSKMFKNGSVILDNPQCQISICGFSWESAFNSMFGASSLDDYATGHCIEFPYSISPVDYVPYGMTYEITSVSCGCHKKHTNHRCDDEQCSKRPLEPDTCAILYREHECHDCIYDEIFLVHGDVFETKNSAVIRSFILRQECNLTMTTFGDRDKQGLNTRYFFNSEPHLKGSPSYYKGGEKFTCMCPNHEVQKSDDIDISNNFILIITGSIILLVFFGSTIILTFIQIRNKKVKKRNFQKLMTDLAQNQIVPSLSLKGENGSKKSEVQILFDMSFEVDRKLLTIDKAIGNGTFGTVYEAHLRVEKGSKNCKIRKVAVKTVHPDASKVNIEDLKSLLNEIRVMQHVGSHPNIVEFIGVCSNLKKLEIFSIMELCRPESLLCHLKAVESKIKRPKLIFDTQKQSNDGYCDSKLVVPNFRVGTSSDDVLLGIKTKLDCKELIKANISEKLAINLVRWSKEIAAGMEYLNDKNVLHIDLAARNILLSENLTAKISDFGLSRKIYDNLDESEKEKVYTKMTGLDRIPYLWTAVESLTDQKYSSKSDVWGYGVTLWEIFSLGKLPYAKYDLKMLLIFLRSGNRLECPEFASNEIFLEMSKCWHATPEKRPNFSEMKKFFESIFNDLIRDYSAENEEPPQFTKNANSLEIDGDKFCTEMETTSLNPSNSKSLFNTGSSTRNDRIERSNQIVYTEVEVLDSKRPELPFQMPTEMPATVLAEAKMPLLKIQNSKAKVDKRKYNRGYKAVKYFDEGSEGSNKLAYSQVFPVNDDNTI